jgi:hypothetical protein
MILEESPQALLDDAEPECGMEHPRLAGNYCVLDMNHKDAHVDGADNEWIGGDYS